MEHGGIARDEAVQPGEAWLVPNFPPPSKCDVCGAALEIAASGVLACENGHRKTYKVLRER